MLIYNRDNRGGYSCKCIQKSNGKKDKQGTNVFFSFPKDPER